MLCKLCESREAIKNSHVIPRFVGAWLKQTSPLGGLRNVDEPNVRRQDTTKIPLLCNECDELFGRRGESPFAQNIFYPFNDEGILSFKYSDWLLYFTVSVNWRVGVSLLEMLRNENAGVALQLEAVLSDWRNFLLDRPSETRLFAHHLFFDSMHHCREFVGLSYDEIYALRTISYGIPYGPKRIGVYVKLPGMVFFTCASPPDFGEWHNTRISTNGILQSDNQVVAEQFFWKHMRHDTLNKDQKMTEGMSDRQKNELKEKAKKSQPAYRLRQARSKKKGCP